MSVLSLLSRWARPIVLVDAALLMGGVMLTAFNLLLIGWSVFIVAWVLAIVGFLAIAALHRERMDGWTWFALLVLEAGLLLALPQLVEIWSAYSANPDHYVMQLPAETYPIGMFANLVLWIGLAFFGLAARGARVLPAGVGWVFVAAALIGFLGDFVHAWPFSPMWWVLAMIVVAFGLVGSVSGERTPSSAVVAEPAP